MNERPYTVLSCAVSLDGHIDDSRPERLVLSSPADLDRVDAVRSGSDAILIGAGTLRKDDPGLRVVSAERRASRVARGLPPLPTSVVVTRSGNLGREHALWQGPQHKLVYCPAQVAPALADRLAGLAEVVPTGPAVDVDALLRDLRARGVGQLLVEGGQEVHTSFLTAGKADEVHLAVAPLFVGAPTAPRFLGPGAYPSHRLRLAEARAYGDTVLLRYLVRPLPTEVTR
ncbi:RibD family protein [Streptomyces sp. NBC_01335]|nr:RibD family protein [Streptomyces sp. NBC_01335]